MEWSQHSWIFVFLIIICTGISTSAACSDLVDLSGPTGNVSSPNYPQSYPQNFSCQVTSITVSPDRIIRLTFDGFSLGEPDVLMITEPDKVDPLVLRAGGLPKNYYSSGNSLQINFTSEGNSTGDNNGFMITYTELDKDLPDPKILAGSFTIKPGKPVLIRSVDYPQSYDNFAFYFWTFESENGSRVFAEIINFETEDNYDFLEFGNGNNASRRFETRLFRTSGSVDGVVGIVSDDNKMWMLFESDYSVVARGFSIMLYQFDEANPPLKNESSIPTEVTCGGNVSISAGGSSVITSPDVHNMETDNNELCIWRVSGVPGLRIRLTSIEFDLEFGYDILEIGNGLDPTEESSHFISLFGSGPTSPIMMESDSIWLKFYSDNSVQSQGFKLELDQPISQSCGGELHITDAMPNVTVSIEDSFTNATQCQWVIHGRPGHFISGNINRFSTEGLYDMVEIGRDDNPADPKTRLRMMSGSVEGGKFYTPAETIWVTFTNDGTQDGEGFSITFNDDACGITTVLDRHGEIQSPGYPDWYPSYADCQWIIQVRGDHKVKLTVNEFQTEYGFDKLLIGGVEPQDSGWTPYYELTGDMVMPGDEVESVYNGVSLRFISDGSSQDMGFSISFEETYTCPDGYVLGNNGSACYKFVLDPSTWEDARDECLQVPDGDLLVIDERMEFEYIKEMSANISGDWWVGWYDQAIEGQWSWVDCQAITVWAGSNWANGAPGDAAMEEDCGMLLGNSGLLDDRNCSIPMKFVCETTKKSYSYSDAFPSFIRGSSTSGSSIHLSWRVSSLVCDLRGYQIRYNTTVAMDQFIYMDITDPMTSSYEVTGLIPDTNYLFEFVIDTFSYGLSSYRTAKSIFASTANACSDLVDLTGPTGNVSSPNYPQSYPQNFSCQVTSITVSQDRIIRLTFDGFSLGESDVLMITEPDKVDPLVLGAGGLPKNYYSSGNSLQINFTSEGNSTGDNNGFMITYTELDKDLPDPKLLAGSFTIKPGKPVLIRSVDYPQSYDNFAFYFWTFESANGSRVFAEIMDFETEDNYDFLEFGNGNDASRRFETRLFRTSGSVDGVVGIVSDDNKMWILFESDYSVVARGFSIMLYQFDEANPPLKNESSIPTEVTCGGNVSISDGGSSVITSPDVHNMEAGNNELCIWRVSGVPGLRIRLTSIEFDLEFGYDILEIGNGLDPTEESSHFISLFGSGPTSPIMMESDSIWLKFYSDSSVQSQGFKLELDQPISQSCGGELHITDAMPNVTVSIEDSFTNATQCQWVIHGRPGHFISGNINRFSTEGLYDMVEIGRDDNPADPKTRLRMMSGSVEGGKFYTPAETIWVTFTNDGTQDGEGFSITFTDDACGITTVLDRHGEIQSPGYPDWYPSYADCQWIIQVRGDHKVKLTVNEFQTEYGFDKLLIGGVEPQDSGWTPYYELTGDMVMPGDEVESVYNGVSLRFISDGSSQDMGFSISFEETYTCPDGYVLGNNGSACYKFVLDPSTWEDARDECLQVPDGDLLVIDERMEFEYIKEMSANISGDWWVGLYDQAIEGQWSWVDCQASTDWAGSNWASGAPGDAAMEEDCGMLLGNSGLLDDRNCSIPMKFVCETTKKSYSYSDAFPSFIRGSSTSGSSIHLSWRVSSVVCDLRGYQIRYNTTAAMDQFIYMDITDPMTSSYEVTGLMPDTNYLFEFVIDTFSYGLSSYRTAKSIFASTGTENKCLDDFELGYGDKCYKIVKQLVTYEQAREECQRTPGGDLVIIDDEEEQEYIQNRTVDGDWWIGLNDRAVEGRFRWTDCSQPTTWQTSQWAPDQPDDLTGSQDCVQLVETFGWNDWQCDRTMQYICEIIEKSFDPDDVRPSDFAAVEETPYSINLSWSPPVFDCDIKGYAFMWNRVGDMPQMLQLEGVQQSFVVVEGLVPGETYVFQIAAETFREILPFSLPQNVTLSAGTGSCPKDYEIGLNNDTCYKFVKKLVTWDEARMDCRSVQNSDLIIIDDAAELNYVMGRVVDGDWWIGLSDRGTEGRWRSVNCSDITAWQASNWAPDQPNDLSGTQDCGQLLETGQWNDWQCDRPMQYICEIASKGYSPGEQLATNLTVVDVSSTTVTLSWMLPDFTCDIFGYTITYVTSLSIYTLRVEGGDTSEVTVRDLLPLTVYRFSIQTRTAMGESDSSDTVTVNTEAFEGCQDVELRTDLSGNFSSPLFPNDYPRLVDCLYRIDLSSTAGNDARIRLRFLFFSLVGDDYLEIRELDPSARNYGNPLILRERGPIKDYLSFGSSLEIMFVSDASSESSGFQILYSQFEEVQPADKDCGTTYTIKSNSFLRLESAGYPNGYGNYQLCTWFLSSRQGTVILAKLRQADLEEGYDRLEIGSGNDPTNATTVLASVSGQVQGLLLSSEDNMMWMTFYSDYSISGKGFSFLIEEVDPDDVPQPKPQSSNDFGIQATCGSNVQVPTDGQESIKTPNYPNNYDSNTTCTSLVTGIPGRRFQMIFEDFKTEKGYDELTVGSGLDPSDLSSEYAVLSGSSLPDNIVLVSDTAWIVFQSDISVNDRGFSIILQNSNDCEVTLTIPPGGNATVMSPNHPGLYPNNTYCFWTIIAASGQPVRADVVSFKTDKGYDFVDIGVGQQPANLSTRFIHASGSDLEPFSTESNTLWMTFTSDGTDSDEGFQIVFFDDNCDDTVIENATSGRIESLNYPNTYPNNLDCTWTIRVRDTLRVKLQFEAFDVESVYDNLIVDGVNGGGSLTLTGSSLPADIISQTNEITLRFQTSMDGGASGFALNFEETYYCPDGYISFQIGEDYTCYKISADQKSWVDARKDCQTTENGDLIIIENALENAGIARITGGDDWWLGFYDRANEGAWRWVDCQASTSWGTLNWDNPEGPDSTNGDEDCAVILDSSGRYEALPCETPRRYICEIGEPKTYDGNPVSLSGYAISTSFIRLEWVRSPQRCEVINYFVQYSTASGNAVELIVSGSNTNSLDVPDLARDTSYFFTIAALTFTDGRLPDSEPVEIRTLQSDSDFCPPGFQVGFNYECYKFSTVPATWDEARADCRSVENGDLVDINTYPELLYINETVSGENLWIGYYDKGIEGDWRWSDCELPNAWQAVNWAPGSPDDPLGNQDCAAMTPDLLWDDQPCNGNVRNRYVCEIYTKNYEDTDQNPLEITVTALTPTKVSLVWTLSIRFVCDVLGYNIQYSFDDQMPKFQRVEEAVTVRAVVKGLVPNKNYTFSVSAYTSLGDVAPSTFTNFVTPDGDLCPPGYEEGYDYGCYRFVTDMRSWNEARTDCQATEDGDLLILESQAELDYITQRKQGISGTWWIGFYDSAEEGVWRWVDCSAPTGLNGSYWADGEPSDTTGTENCAELTQDSKFNDLPCASEQMYVCEITPKEFFPSDANPSDLQGVSTTPVSVLLSWIVSEFNCDIQGYKILYSVDQETENVQIVAGPNTNTVNITGLTPVMLYTFKLLAYTEFGDREIVSIITVTTPQIPNPCPEDGWELGFGGKCYKFVNRFETWYDARAVCQQDADGDLVIIETQEENLYIQDRMQGGDWWIGFYDVSVEGDWRWIDCSTPSAWTLSNWGAEQPNNLNGNQNCGQILNDGKYNDWQCDRTMQFICEINPLLFDPSAGNPTRFRVSEDTPNSVFLQWRPSLLSCDVIGYSIRYNNPIINDVINVPGGNASSVTVADLQDGRTYFFSIAGYTEQQLLPYSEAVSIVTPPLDGLCEDGWEPGPDYKCYKFGLEQKTWEEARADCESITDGDLVLIETEEEHGYLVNRTLGGDWWIGLYDQGTEGDWRWLNCDAPGTWASINWGANQPNDLDGSQDCGQMLQSGLWNDWNCMRPMQYICEINPKAFTTDDLSPLLFRGLAVDPATIQLNWLPGQYTCEVRGYRIVYEEAGMGKTQLVEGGTTSSTLLKNLIPGTVYVFYIGAFTQDEQLDLGDRSVRIQLPLTGVCGETDWTATSGTITSPNYPSSYPANQDCVFTINLPEITASIQIDFMALDLEKGHDFLFIGEGVSPDVDTQYALTGNDVPKMIMLDSNQAWIRFFSDESNERPGFSLVYSTAEADKSGESIGSLTIVLISQTYQSFSEAVRKEFAVTMANQLNIYCKLSQENCLVNSEAVFTYEDIRFTNLQDMAEGLQVTFWVIDPSDPTRRQAALTSSQLQALLDEYQAELENDGQFQFVVRADSSPLNEPWIIALLCIIGLLVLLLLVVIVRDLASRGKRKSSSFGSISDVEMKSRDDSSSMDDGGLIIDSDSVPLTSAGLRIQSATTENVYFVNPVSTIETEPDQDQQHAAAEPDDPQVNDLKGEVNDLKEEVNDLKEEVNGNTEVEVEVEPEPLYAVSSKESFRKD